MLETKFLKDNIDNIQKLMTIPPLRNFEVRSLRQLLRLSKMREYADGERIIQEGDQDPWLYFLLSGEVRIVKDGVEIATFARSGEIIGEMRLLDGSERSASVFASGRVICLAVDTSATDRLESRDERAAFLLLLYRMFSEYIVIRLRTTNEELVLAKRELERLRKAAGEPGPVPPAGSEAEPDLGDPGAPEASVDLDDLDDLDDTLPPHPHHVIIE